MAIPYPYSFMTYIYVDVDNETMINYDISYVISIYMWEIKKLMDENMDSAMMIYYVIECYRWKHGLINGFHIHIPLIYTYIDYRYVISIYNLTDSIYFLQSIYIFNEMIPYPGNHIHS